MDILRAFHIREKVLNLNLCDRGPLLKSSVFNTVKIVMVRLIPGRVTFKYNMFSKLESTISCRLIYNYLKTITVLLLT